MKYFAQRNGHLYKLCKRILFVLVDQSINAVTKIVAVCCDDHREHKYGVWTGCSLVLLWLVVRIITTGFKWSVGLFSGHEMTVNSPLKTRDRGTINRVGCIEQHCIIVIIHIHIHIHIPRLTAVQPVHNRPSTCYSLSCQLYGMH